MLHRLIYCFLPVLSFPSLLHAQGGTEDLDSVTVNGSRTDLQRETNVSITKLVILRRLATDVGQLMTLFPGVQVKSYGGLGGMKTVSFRSLGAGHTSIVYDHFALSQTQSGQTDVGQIPVDFVNSLKLVSQAGISLDYPIHAKVAGQIIAIDTRHTEKSPKPFQLNVGAQTGSFGQYDGHAYVSKRIQKFNIAGSVKGRMFDGDYPFAYRNVDSSVRTTRSNGDLKEVFGTASIGYFVNPRNTIHASWTGAAYDKGLPGAVVFYNNAAGQRLSGSNHLLTLRHVRLGKRFDGATTASFQQSTLDYADSNYLNAQGYLHSHYLSQQSDGHTQWRYRSANDSLYVLLGTGARFEQLFTETFAITPQRFTIDGIAAAQWTFRGMLSGQLGVQHVSDVRPDQTRTATVLLPAMEWKGMLFRRVTAGAGYRYTVRQPSFNEMYYNQVGNSGLRPEKAHLLYLNIGWERYLDKKNDWWNSSTLQPFYTLATDKILAIPTKNLFVWSIQNIGKSQAFGVEAVERMQLRTGIGVFATRLNYTFQYAQDISDPDGPTYGHVLSYSPLHSGTAELSYERHRWEMSALLTYQGERYALNQNIPANLLEDFVLLDISASYRFSFRGRSKSQLVVRAAVNNVTNNYYSYIRYFVMPGINWTLRVSYDF